MLAIDYIRNDFRPLGPDAPADYAFDLMNEFKVSHLPVVENGHFLGLISEDDLLNDPDGALSVKSGTTNLIRVFLEDDKHLFDALPLFYHSKLSMVPVVKPKGDYCGYLHAEDVVQEIGNSLSFTQGGGILVFDVPTRDYHLAEMVQIVESNNARVLSVFTREKEDRNMLEVTLKINLTDLSSIIETFGRYDYSLIASFHKSHYNEDLQDRFESFMKYLNM